MIYRAARDVCIGTFVPEVVPSWRSDGIRIPTNLSSLFLRQLDDIDEMMKSSARLTKGMVGGMQVNAIAVLKAGKRLDSHEIDECCPEWAGERGGDRMSTQKLAADVAVGEGPVILQGGTVISIVRGFPRDVLLEGIRHRIAVARREMH